MKLKTQINIAVIIARLVISLLLLFPWYYTLKIICNALDFYPASWWLLIVAFGTDLIIIWRHVRVNIKKE